MDQSKPLPPPKSVLRTMLENVAGTSAGVGLGYFSAGALGRALEKAPNFPLRNMDPNKRKMYAGIAGGVAASLSSTALLAQRAVAAERLARAADENARYLEAQLAEKAGVAKVGSASLARVLR